MHWGCPLALTPALSRREKEPIGVSRKNWFSRLDLYCHTQNVQTLEISSLSWGRGLG
ncbi:Ig-like domain-containing protein [Pseudomonas zeae]